MKTLSARDASVLTTIAGSSKLSPKQRKTLVASLSETAKPIANAMKGGSAPRHSEAVKAARTVKMLTDSNRKVSEDRVQRRFFTAS